MKLFAKLSKVDEASRTVFGRAVQEITDKVGEVFDYKSSKPHFEKWSQDIHKATDGKSLGNIRAMHGNVCAGKATGIIFHDDECAIDVEAKIVDDNEWNKVLEGCYTGFSIGGNYAKKWPDADNPKLIRYEAVPAEISIVDNPCGPTSTFTVVRADGSQDMRKFAQKEPAPVPSKTDAEVAAEAALATEKAAVDELAGLFNDGKVKPSDVLRTAKAAAPGPVVLVVDTGLSASVVAALTKAVGREVVVTVATPAEEPAFALRRALIDPEINNGAVEKLAAQHLPEAERTGTVLELLPRLDKAAMPMAQYQAALKTELDGVKDPAKDTEAIAKRFLPGGAVQKDGKPDIEATTKALQDVVKTAVTTTETDLAKGVEDKFADPENKKYPIETAPHIKAAWQFINRARNIGKYSADQVKTIKARVASAWKRVIDKDGPPVAEAADKSVRAEALRKYLYNVADMARVCQALWDMARSSKFEQEYENDADSTLPSRLSALATEAGEILCEMAEEETQEEADKGIGKADFIATMRKEYVGTDSEAVFAATVKRIAGRKDAIKTIGEALGLVAPTADAAKAATAGLCKTLGIPETSTDDDVRKHVADLKRRAEAYDKLPAQPKGVLKAAAVRKGDETAAAEVPSEIESLIKKAEGGDVLAQMRLAHMRPNSAPPPSATKL